jgi:hypothetical protein
LASNCHGLCDHEKPAIGMRFYDKKTGAQWKKCKKCEKRIKTDDTRCYCCGYKLQTGPLKLKHKLLIREIKRI